MYDFCIELNHLNAKNMELLTPPANSPVKEKILKERKVKGMVFINIQKCKGCELCQTSCKENALFLSDKLNDKGYRYILANNDLCTGCVNCALVCPDAVITVYRTNPKKKNIDVTPKDIIPEMKLILSSPVYTDLTNMGYI